MEDDSKIARLLEIFLQNHGYQVKIAPDGEKGWEEFVFFDPKIVIVDLMLPKFDGFELIEKIRSVDQEVGIIVLTARGEVENRIKGFKKGADDYVPKPFHLEELLARIEALEKRVKKDELLRVGQVIFDPKSRTLTFPDGTETVLSERESSLLYWLVVKAGTVLSREELLELVWKDSENISKNIVDVYIKYLRDKLKDYGGMIKTVRGSGYVLDT
ncbi:response regulator transcription factor [Pseudothermotoga thermarum]|uniref:Two component transcriptional regulator, winged helix family n=1 Tax=Pseudothermotoga thermarum DSM 5069 TaxID=688269 RepID=F7YXN1_9THEM|nr:response regulator transcription factor [Pseudothermotoga thermarum]AEH50675.1 two component transcriptional regulator, winged helix family [Pseudothermotoga thermarum DSM 5069]